MIYRYRIDGLWFLFFQCDDKFWDFSIFFLHYLSLCRRINLLRTLEFYWFLFLFFLLIVSFDQITILFCLLCLLIDQSRRIWFTLHSRALIDQKECLIRIIHLFLWLKTVSSHEQHRVLLTKALETNKNYFHKNHRHQQPQRFKIYCLFFCGYSSLLSCYCCCPILLQNIKSRFERFLYYFLFSFNFMKEKANIYYSN